MKLSSIKRSFFLFGFRVAALSALLAVLSTPFGQLCFVGKNYYVHIQLMGYSWLNGRTGCEEDGNPF